MSFFALCIIVAVALLVRGYTCGQLARRELVDVVESSQTERAGERDALRDAFAGLDSLVMPDPSVHTSAAAPSTHAARGPSPAHP